MNQYLPFAAVILIVLSFLLQLKIFVRSDELEKRLASEREESERKYMNKELCDMKHEPIQDMKRKIDEIYSFLLKKSN